MTIQTAEEYIDSLEEPRRTEIRELHEFIRNSIGRSCVRFKRLSDIDLETVKRLLKDVEQATKA